MGKRHCGRLSPQNFLSICAVMFGLILGCKIKEMQSEASNQGSAVRSWPNIRCGKNCPDTSSWDGAIFPKPEQFHLTPAAAKACPDQNGASQKMANSSVGSRVVQLLGVNPERRASWVLATLTPLQSSLQSFNGPSEQKPGHGICRKNNRGTYTTESWETFASAVLEAILSAPRIPSLDSSLQNPAPGYTAADFNIPKEAIPRVANLVKASSEGAAQIVPAKAPDVVFLRWAHRRIASQTDTTSDLRKPIAEWVRVDNPQLNEHGLSVITSKESDRETLLTDADKQRLAGELQAGLLRLTPVRKAPDGFAGGKFVPVESPEADPAWPVVGDALGYPIGLDVPKMLARWQARATAALKLAPEEYIREIGWLVRACIAIHPFEDGNGRTCKIWSAYALAKRQIPHSVMWSDEDVLLSEQEWVARFEKGVLLHKTMLTQMQ